MTDELTFPITLGQTEILSSAISVGHSIQFSSLTVTRYGTARAGKQKNTYSYWARLKGDQVEIDTGGAVKSLISLEEWQAFADRLPVHVSAVSTTTVEMSPQLVRMARDVVAHRRKPPTDRQWAEETAQQNENKEKTMSDENLIKLSTLVLDAGTQPRAALDEATVTRYAEEMAAGAAFPPIVVFHDGTRHILADGFHRAAAALKAGQHALPADIRQGDVRDAILYSAGANAAHGLPRSSEDVRRVIERLLRDPEWSGWSNRKLAELAHTSHTTVGRVRNELVEAGEIEPASERTYERDGEVKTMNVESIGTKQRLVLRRQIGDNRLIVCGPDEDGEYVGLYKVRASGAWKVRRRKADEDRSVLVDWFERNERTMEAMEAAKAAAPSTGTLHQLEPGDMKPPLAGLSWHDDLLQASREAYRLHPDILACLGKTGIYNIALGRDAIRLTKALHVRGKFVPCAEGAKADWLWVIDTATVEELVNGGHSLARLELDDQAANDLANAVIHDVEMPWEVSRREEAAAYARERKKIGTTTGTLHQYDDGGGQQVFEAGDRVINPVTSATGTVKRVMANGQMLNVAWDDHDPSEGKTVGLSTAKGLQHADTAGVSPAEPEAEAEPKKRDLHEVWHQFEHHIFASGPYGDGDYHCGWEVAGEWREQTGIDEYDKAAEWFAATVDKARTEVENRAEARALAVLPRWLADDDTTPADPEKTGNGANPAAVTPDTLLFHLETVKSGLALLTEQGDDVERAFYASLGRRMDRMSIEMTLKALKAISSPATWKDIRFALANVDLADPVLVDRELNPVLYGFREKVS